MDPFKYHSTAKKFVFFKLFHFVQCSNDYTHCHSWHRWEMFSIHTVLRHHSNKLTQIDLIHYRLEIGRIHWDSERLDPNWFSIYAPASAAVQRKVKRYFPHQQIEISSSSPPPPEWTVNYLGASPARTSLAEKKVLWRSANLRRRSIKFHLGHRDWLVREGGERWQPIEESTVEVEQGCLNTY